MGATATNGQQLHVGENHEGICSAWFDRGRGFGFIKVSGVEQELFVSSRCVVNADALRRGDRVRFEVRMSNTGKLMADCVELR